MKPTTKAYTIARLRHHVECQREKPPAVLAEVIADYKPGEDLYTEGAIDELFTAEECRALIAYLEEHHPGCSHAAEKIDLPVRSACFLSVAFPLVVRQDNYRLCDEENYSLPVQVWGFSDVRNHEPLPDRDSDLQDERHSRVASC